MVGQTSMAKCKALTGSAVKGIIYQVSWKLLENCLHNPTNVGTLPPWRSRKTNC